MTLQDVKFQMRLSSELVEELDAFRALIPWHPSRAAILRWLAERMLAEWKSDGGDVKAAKKWGMQ